MKKLLLLFILLILILTALVSGEKAIPLPELLKPDSITLDRDQIYIGEGTSIYIYDVKNFKLKKTFGKKGEGPREFRLETMRGVEQLTIDVQTENIIVTSMGKVSFFRKDGTYKSELKCHDQSREFIVLGSGFAAQGGLTIENGNRYRAVNIYDPGLNKLKEVFKVKHHFQQGSGLRMFETSYRFATCDNKLFVAWERDFNIQVFDANGKKLFTINRDYEKIKVTDEDKQNVIDFFKTSPRYKELFVILRPLLKFPTHFAALMDMKVSDGKVYAITFKKEDKGFECFIYDTNGKFLERTILPLKQMDDFISQPYTIKNGTFYQLVENEDETWELHISEIR